ncbi:hypothetical protein KAR91_49390 [Candidatus Pacearchaeota archaeon]|nr:hypothetical protein [Candidatus Pacearchaeota archaeon]
MKEATEKAIKILADQVTKDMKSEDALRYTQAALNLAHVLSVHTDTKNKEK